MKTVTGIEKNSLGNGEVRAIVLFHQNGDVLPSASPDGDVVFHIIGTISQQASQGWRMYKISPVAECVRRCS
jgi:hypothetical protein